jgi:hypothetical protein
MREKGKDVAEDKKPITVAGRTYASIEEMPAEIRRVYDLAVAAKSEADNLKIIFNGQEYAGLDSMPAEVRKAYQHQQLAMETYRDFSLDSTTPRAAKVNAPPAKRMEAPPTVPGQSFVKRNKWQLLVVAAIVIIIIVFFWALK